MATFADLSLRRRAVAAIDVIDSCSLSVEQRSEVVCLALWPSATELPGPVSRAARVPDIDLRPARPAATTPPAPRVERPSTPDERAEARAAFLAGASISDLAEQYDQPWTTMRRWANGGR